MDYEIEIEHVATRPLAAVRRQVRIGGVGAAWRPALDQVWAFLRGHEGVWTHGHNIFLYHHPQRRDDPMDVDFGVEVTGPFEGEDEVFFTHTPAGEVASTVHDGPIDRISEAHAAIDAWRAAHGRLFGGYSWEIYGDPGPDPARLQIQIVYLLA